MAKIESSFYINNQYMYFKQSGATFNVFAVAFSLVFTSIASITQA